MSELCRHDGLWESRNQMGKTQPLHAANTEDVYLRRCVSITISAQPDDKYHKDGRISSDKVVTITTNETARLNARVNQVVDPKVRILSRILLPGHHGNLPPTRNRDGGSLRPDKRFHYRDYLRW